MEDAAKTKARVKSITLMSAGIKGAKVEYNIEELVNNFIHPNDIVKRNYAPVPSDLKNKIKELKPHFFVLSGFSQVLTPKDLDNDLIMTYNKISIKSVKLSGEGVILEGAIELLDTNKTISVKTPIIDHDDAYAYYEEMKRIVKEVMDLTADYVANKIAVDKKQYVMEFNVESGNMSKEDAEKEVSNLSDEELMEKMQDIMEEQGIVMIPPIDVIRGEDEDENEQLLDSETPQDEIEYNEEKKLEIPEKGKILAINKDSEVEIPAENKKEIASIGGF